jgi:hypothetical protein
LFFSFIFSPFIFSPFNHKHNTSPPHGNYKWGGRGHIKGDPDRNRPRWKTHLTDQELKLIRHLRDLGSTPSLESL